MLSVSRAVPIIVAAAILVGLRAGAGEAGPALTIHSDPLWLTAAEAPSNWNDPAFDDAAWLPAQSPSLRMTKQMRESIWPADADARTMWHPENPEVAYFRRAFVIEGYAMRDSRITVGASGRADVYVNGRLIGRSAKAHEWPGETYDIGPYLRGGRNVIALRVAGAGGERAALLSAGIYSITSGELETLNVARLDRLHRQETAFIIVATLLAAGLVVVGVRLPYRHLLRTMAPLGRRVRDGLASETLWVFLFALTVLGSFVRPGEMPHSFNIHHSLVEALAERGQFHIGGSSTQKFRDPQPGVDFTTGPGDHRYALKPPGAFMAGAVVYYPLHHLFGLSYEKNYVTSLVLVAFLTTTLLTALGVTLIYLLVRQITGSRLGAGLVALTYGCGTIAFPYAGLLHHDQTGAFFIIAAFYFSFQAHHRESPSRLDPLVAGVLLGLAPLFTFTGGVAAAVIGLYFVSFLRPRKIALFAVGVAIGVAPLIAVNWSLFGGPLTTIYHFSKDRAVQTTVTKARVLERLHFYFSNPNSGILFYSPILALTVPGLLLFPRGYVRERLAIMNSVVFTYAYLCVADTDAGSQFGTRLILPFLPLLCLALLPFWMKGGPLAKRPLKVLFCLLLVVSLFLCGLGATVSTMFPYAGKHNAWLVYWQSLTGPPRAGIHHFQLPTYPLRYALTWLRIPIEFVLIWTAVNIWRREKPR